MSPCRVGLVTLLLGAMEAVFVIEQPSTSLFFDYCYMKAAIRMLRTSAAKALQGWKWGRLF